MPVPDLIKEGERQMMICNACRYCEGYCAVFPAMEQRRMFTKADLVYLANLCFDCRDCYYACQYAPPHEFGVNIPKLMAELRTETYREYSWPAILSVLLKRNGIAVSLITVGATLVIFILVLLFTGPDVLTATHLGDGSFYRVVPYIAMTIPANPYCALWPGGFYDRCQPLLARDRRRHLRRDQFRRRAARHPRCIRSRIHEGRRRRL